MPGGPVGLPGRPRRPSGAGAPRQPRRRPSLLIAAGVAYWQLRDTSQALAESDRILIADFGNTTGDAMFDGTLKQALAVKLEESPFLNVVADQRVRETLAFMSRPAGHAGHDGRGARDLPAAGDQGGHARRHRDARLIVCRHADGRELPERRGARARAGRPPRARNRCSRPSGPRRRRCARSSASRWRRSSGWTRPIEQATTSSLEALKAFSLGDQKRNKGSDPEAIPFFKPRARARPGLRGGARTAGHGVLEPRRDRGWPIEHRTRAYELRERVSERERFYIAGHYYSGVTRRDRQGARDLRPLEADVSARPGAVHQQRHALLAARRKRAHARRPISKAVEIDPTRRIAYANLFGKYLELDRLDDARGAPRSADQEPRRNAGDAVNVLRARRRVRATASRPSGMRRSSRRGR